MVLEKISAANEIEGYDFYIQSYPDTEPYTTQTQNKAEQLALSIEEQEIKKIKKDYAKKPRDEQEMLERRARKLLSKMRKLLSESKSSSTVPADQVKIERWDKLLSVYYEDTNVYLFSTERGIVNKSLKQLTLSIIIMREIIKVNIV